MKNRLKAAAAVAALAVVPLVLVGAVSASASHFRASGTSFTMSGNQATWTINGAWALGDADAVFSQNPGDTLGVQQLTSAADTPDTGSPTGVDLTLTSYTADQTGSMFDLSTEVLEGDLSALGDGIYEVYSSSCCRIGGVQNTPTGDFSNWARFTKTGTAFDLPPKSSNLSLYELVKPVGDTTLDFSAVDPEGGAVSYSFVTDGSSPFFGATELPCSTFVNGVLTLGPSHCVAPDVFTDIYLQGSFWSVKILASDAAGNAVSLNSLLHVLQAPEPYIGKITHIDNGLSAEFSIYDNNEEPIDSSTVTCVSQTDPSDVVTGTSTSNPVVLYGFTIGSAYDCTVTSTNAAGSGTMSYTEDTGTFVLDGVAIVTDLPVGSKLSGHTIELVGDNLAASSAYTLVQTSDPVTLRSGTTTVAGNFTDTFAVPSTACVAGAHTLTLTGTSAGGGAAVDRVWYELDSSCTVVQFSRLGPVTVTAAALAVTGVAVSPLLPLGAAVLILLGAASVAVATRRTRSV